MSDIARCDAEIAEAERQLRAGHPDVNGLCLAIADWSAEKRMIEVERARRDECLASE